MRIAFVGAQGTGKTTLVNKLAGHGGYDNWNHIYHEVVRELVNADWHAVFIVDPDLPAFKKSVKAYYIRSEYLSPLPHIKDKIVPKQYLKPQKLSSLTKSS